MSRRKKRKNLEHTKALNRKDNATNEMNTYGLDINSELKSIGIFFEHLGISHLNYMALNQINLFCQNKIGVDISIFAYKYLQPCINTFCPTLDVKRLERWQYPLITTSIHTSLDALTLDVSDVYYYAFDLEFIYNNYPLKDLIFVFNNSKVFVRHLDHKKLIMEEFNININSVIPDFDLVKIIKMIMENTNGKNTMQE